MPSLLSIPQLKLGFWETGVVSHETLSILAPPKGSRRARSWRLVTRKSKSDRQSLSGSTGQHPLVTNKEELHQFFTTWDCTALHQRGRQTGPAESRKVGTLKCNVYADLGHTGHIGRDLNTVYHQSFRLLAPPVILTCHFARKWKQIVMVQAENAARSTGTTSSSSRRAGYSFVFKDREHNCLCHVAALYCGEVCV